MHICVYPWLPHGAIVCDSTLERQGEVGGHYLIDQGLFFDIRFVITIRCRICSIIYERAVIRYFTGRACFMWSYHACVRNTGALDGFVDIPRLHFLLFPHCLFLEMGYVFFNHAKLNILILAGVLLTFSKVIHHLEVVNNSKNYVFFFVWNGCR